MMRVRRRTRRNIRKKELLNEDPHRITPFKNFKAPCRKISKNHTWCISSKSTLTSYLLNSPPPLVRNCFQSVNPTLVDVINCKHAYCDQIIGKKRKRLPTPTNSVDGDNPANSESDILDRKKHEFFSSPTTPLERFHNNFENVRCKRRRLGWLIGLRPRRFKNAVYSRTFPPALSKNGIYHLKIEGGNGIQLGDFKITVFQLSENNEMTWCEDVTLLEKGSKGRKNLSQVEFVFSFVSDGKPGRNFCLQIRYGNEETVIFNSTTFKLYVTRTKTEKRFWEESSAVI